MLCKCSVMRLVQQVKWANEREVYKKQRCQLDRDWKPRVLTGQEGGHAVPICNAARASKKRLRYGGDDDVDSSEGPALLGLWFLRFGRAVLAFDHLCSPTTTHAAERFECTLLTWYVSRSQKFRITHHNSVDISSKSEDSMMNYS